MSLTASTMMELGTEIPSFALPDVSSGRMVRPAEQGPILVMFICRHCPYVIHIKSELAKIGKDALKARTALEACQPNDSPRMINPMSAATTLSSANPPRKIVKISMPRLPPVAGATYRSLTRPISTRIDHTINRMNPRRPLGSIQRLPRS